MPTDRIQGVKLDHIALGVRHLADAVDLVVGCFGGQPDHGGPGLGFRGAQWKFRDGERIEIIEPDGPEDGFLHRFLDSRGPGIHHVTFKVPDIYRAADIVREHGYTVVGFNDAFEGWKEMFLHPRQAQGIVVQLAQTHPLIPDDSWTTDFPFPSYNGAVPDPVRVLGLRLTTSCLDRARAQWEHLLGGFCDNTDGGLAFEWPDSPLRIFVEEHRDREAGPLQLEIAASDQGVSYDSEIAARLGVRIVTVAPAQAGRKR